MEWRSRWIRKQRWNWLRQMKLGQPIVSCPRSFCFPENNGGGTTMPWMGRSGDEGGDQEENCTARLREDSDTEDVDDSTFKRFLIARDLDVNKASNFLLKHLAWKRVAIPKGFISESEIQNEIAQKKMFSQGFDKKSRPIGVIIGYRHDASSRDLNEFKCYAVYVIEKICSRMQRNQEKFTFIVDLQGWGYSNLDIRAYLAGLDILQNNYPERLGKLLILHAPYLFMKAWNIIYPFIDSTTKSKIVFVENKKMKEMLMEDIDESQLPEDYGGKLKLLILYGNAKG